MRPKQKSTPTGSEPFYGDVLARSLLRINVPRYPAYQIAQEIWQTIRHEKKDPKKIAKLAAKLLRKKYPELMPAYKNWRKIMRKRKPLIILLGGGTGIGTSTLALRIAWLLEIEHIVSTDTVREVIRQFVGKNVLPILHVSSYQAGQLIEQVKSSHDRLIYGFLSQSQEVLNGVEAIIQRAITEETSMVIEGVHLIPGQMKFLDKYKNKAFIIQVVLDVEQKPAHRRHFFLRAIQSAKRGKAKYLKYFKEIRLIRDYLIKEAEKNQVPVIKNYNLRKAEKAVLQKIYSDYFQKK